MNIQEFANKLNGREYGFEITKEEEKEAEYLGYVVVFGYSDDNIEFRGAINDEIGCYGAKRVYLDKNGIIEKCECHCKYWGKAKENAKTIKAVSNDDDCFEFYWHYETDIPHATFEIYENGEDYCKGIVFDMKELN
jgi:hypothetical protein